LAGRSGGDITQDRFTALGITGHLVTLRRIWASAGAPENTGWPDEGVAILGDLAGIQAYVLRPVPGAGGAARRLRARSFQVSAMNELIARRLESEFRAEGASIFYSAGGRFLIWIRPCPDWRARLEKLQAELDRWLLKEFEGEVVFHLAGWPFRGGKVPAGEVHLALRENRNRPLSHGLKEAGQWNEASFVVLTKEGSRRCPACIRTVTKVVKREDEEICPDCDRDTELGKDLANTDDPVLVADDGGRVKSPVGTYGVVSHGKAAGSKVDVPVIRWTPRKGSNSLSFEDIAKLAPGNHEWLGYLRIDADGVGDYFQSLGGSPARTKSLSEFLDMFFTRGIQELLERRFQNIYPVYGGGDDLFVIGAWHDAIDFAIEVYRQFQAGAGSELTLSAGLSLAKAHEHILSCSAEAAANLHRMKESGRNGFCVFGSYIRWEEFDPVLRHARQATQWAGAKTLPKAFLLRLLVLHQQWERLSARLRRSRKGQADAGPRLNPARVRALLCYHIDRNIPRWQRDLRDWTEGFLDLEGWQWRHAGFIARYATLAAGEVRGR
jgi:CRISPR-associated protein Csm1